MGEAFDDPRDDLIIENGKAHCPDCDEWWPEGMEYMYLHHYPRHREAADE